MTTPKTVPEGYIKKETMWLIAVAAVAFGFMAGIVFTVFKSGPGQPPATVVQQQSQTPAQAPPAQQQDAAVILSLEREVLTNPDNLEAWTHLGNAYFDSNNFSKAITAYTKALELEPNNAHVLTDLGVMYRRNGNPQEAVNSFKKAVALDPKLDQARFNMGIVLLYDLQDKDGALQVWEELAQINPNATAPNGQLITDIIKSVREQ